MMQNVWSRVAQSRSFCNCSSCVSATNALTRRVTTSASRRRIRVGDAFTVFSSSLAVAATLVDSKRKDARREHWDRIISKARAVVEEIEDQQESRLETLSRIAEQGLVNEATPASPLSPTITPQARPHWKRTPHEPPETRSFRWAEVFEWATYQDQLRIASGFQDFKGVPLNLLQVLSVREIEQLLAEKHTLRRFFYGGPDCLALQDETLKLSFSTRSLRNLEWATAMLVWQLLSHCPESSTANICQLLTGARYMREHVSSHNKSSGEPKPPVTLKDHREIGTQSHLAENASEDGPVRKIVLKETQIKYFITEAKAHLKALWDKDTPEDHLTEAYDPPRLPIYSQNLKRRARDASELNHTLFSLLSQMKEGMDSTPLLSQVCYTLLASPSPPTIHTYNLLLIRFCQLRKQRLVEAVWDSMCKSNVRTNEITYSTLLRFFTSVKDEAKFRRLVRRMKGYEGGVALVKGRDKFNPIAMERMRRKDTRAKAVEKARMNSEVYECLIIGALEFMGVQTAMYYYKMMVNEGWGPTTEILNAILRDCCSKADWEGGYSVWQQISVMAGKASKPAYEWMLRLCEKCNKYHEFFQVLQKGSSQGALSAPMSVLFDDLRGSSDGLSAENVKERIRRANRQEYCDKACLQTVVDDLKVQSIQRALATATGETQPTNSDSSLSEGFRRTAGVNEICDEQLQCVNYTTPSPGSMEWSHDSYSLSDSAHSAKDSPMTGVEFDLSNCLKSFNPQDEVVQPSTYVELLRMENKKSRSTIILKGGLEAFVLQDGNSRTAVAAA